MQRRRRLAHGTPSLQVRIVGRDHRRKQRQRDKKRDNEESERRSLAAQQSTRRTCRGRLGAPVFGRAAKPGYERRFTHRSIAQSRIDHDVGHIRQKI